MNIIEIFRIYIIILFIVFCCSMYLYTKNNKLYLYILQLITVFSTITIMFSLVITSYAQYHIESQDSINGYGTNLNLFLNDIIKLFLDRPHMMYMYNEMMTGKTEQKIIRHKNEEIMLGCYIFANCAKVTAYIYESNNIEDANRIKAWLTKVLTTYLKSSILVNVWKTEYKPKLAGPLLMKYMDETFSI